MAWEVEPLPTTVKKRGLFTYSIIVSVLLHNVGGILQRLHHKTDLALKSFKKTN
jgi:hypothetical protein